jgi:hypothetical protein
MAGSRATALLGSITIPVNVIRGTSKDDSLYGTLGRDNMFGEGGNDVLDAFEGDDQLSGGSGNDILFANKGNDKLFGDGGNDDLYADEGDDQLSGGDGNDILHADEGNDWISGDAGQDQIFGGPGRNTILGGTGRDFAIGASGDDDISGGTDADWLSGGPGHDTVTGEAGNDLIGGGDGNDLLHGEVGRDKIHGGSGRDDLRGGIGDDDLRGGWGQDRILGEAGNDRMFGERGNDWLSGGGGNDTIYGGGGPDYTLQARIVVPVSNPGYPHPREMIQTDGETLLARNGWSELLTYDVDTQHLVGQFIPLAEGRLLDVSVSDGRVLVGSPQRSGTMESPLARLYDTAGHVLRDLTSPDPTDTSFGARVALEDDRAVVASDRAAYVYDAANGQLEHTIPLPPSLYGWQWPPLDVELSGNTIAIHAGAFEGEEIYVLNASAGTFVRQIEVPPKLDSGLDSSLFRSVDLTGDKVVFSDPMTRESNPDATEPSSKEPVYLYDADTGRQVRVLERETPESLSPIYSRLVDGVEADGGEIGIADDYVAGPDGPSISPIISVLDAETGKPIQRLDDPDMTGQFLGFAFSGGVLAIEQYLPENSVSSVVSLFWRDRPQDGGDDFIWGGSGDDRLFGSSGLDKLFGGDGRDRLSGDVGDDSLWGGRGADIFVIGQASGYDRLMDFRSDDRILFTSTKTASFDALKITETPTGTLVATDTDVVELIGICLNELDPGWFLFA